MALCMFLMPIITALLCSSTLLSCIVTGGGSIYDEVLHSHSFNW